MDKLNDWRTYAIIGLIALPEVLILAGVEGEVITRIQQAATAIAGALGISMPQVQLRRGDRFERPTRPDHDGPLI